eukprot:m.22576 g.22576  ORF g.22576 m.22576 type:complete len:625 (+) comp28360_c0_seq1:55-1929(+)
MPWCCVLLLSWLALASGSSSLSQQYKFGISLNDDGSYWLFWTVNHDAGEIDIAVQVKTKGWIGFGVSPDGKMPNSDIVTGWVKDGKGFLQDRHSVGRYLPPVDTQQNVQLIEAWENDMTTVLRFRRKLKACEANDRDIDTGTARIIWAYHPDDPDSIDGLERHIKKGGKNVNLLDGRGSVEPFPSNTSSFEIITNQLKVPSDITTYWCKPAKLPVLPNGGYIIGFGPSIQHKEIVHHMLVYRCNNAAAYLNTEGPCGTLDDSVNNCWGRGPIGAWAVGGQEVHFPDEAGLPFSGSNGLQYVLLGIHYNNEKMRSDYVDSSGLKFYYSTQRRKHNASILEVGNEVRVSGFFLPPGLPSLPVTSFCPSSCLQAGIPSEGVKVFGVFLHTHTSGIAIHTTQYRNGKEVGDIGRNDHYDFNFQDYLFPERNITIFPGDSIRTTCTYSTEARTKTTFGGLSTTDEMCLAYMVIYPSASLQSCLSQKTTADLTAFASQAYAKGWATYFGDSSDDFRRGMATFDSTKPGAEEAFMKFLNVTKVHSVCRGEEGVKLIGDQDVTVPVVQPDPPPVKEKCSFSLASPPTFQPSKQSFSSPTKSAGKLSPSPTNGAEKLFCGAFVGLLRLVLLLF